MKFILGLILLCCFIKTSTADQGSCQGKFLNPITDICWSCIFPISLGGKAINAMGQ